MITNKSALVAALLLIAGLLRAQVPQQDALALYRQGAFAEAVTVTLGELERYGIDETRRRMDAYTVLGWSLIRLGQYERALNFARRARGEMRYDIRIVEIQGEALYYLGRNTEALAIFEEYVSLGENAPGDRINLVYYFMGEIFLRLAEYQHADIAFSTALYHSPQAARWWARLGYAREQIKDTDGAEAAYTTALDLQPSLEDARIGLERVRG